MSTTAMIELAKRAAQWPERLKIYKNEGVPIIGSTGRYVPHELIHAAGAKHYFLCRGGEPEPPEAVLPYMLRFMSPYARAQIGYFLLRLDPVIPILDLIIAQCTSCHMSRLADLFEYFKLPTLKLGVPLDYDKVISQEYYLKQLAHFRLAIQNVSGNAISDKALRSSIKTLNKVRSSLQQIDQLRKNIPPPIGGYDFIRLNHYAYCDDFEALPESLTSLYESLRHCETPFSPTAPRILLAGHVIAMGDYVALKLVEDAGGVVVAELLDEGMWNFRCLVSEDGDPLQSLASTYYLREVPPSVFNYSWSKRRQTMESILQEYSIDGVIWYQLSFDEIHSLESAAITEHMKKLGVPFLKLESSYEYSREAMGPLTTRIESFIGSIRPKGR